MMEIFLKGFLVVDSSDIVSIKDVIMDELGTLMTEALCSFSLSDSKNVVVTFRWEIPVDGSCDYISDIVDRLFGEGYTVNGRIWYTGDAEGYYVITEGNVKKHEDDEQAGNAQVVTADTQVPNVSFGMTISDLCYELYKLEWMRKIGLEDHEKKLRSYYASQLQCIEKDGNMLSVRQKIVFKQCPSYDEFLAYEYLEKWYISSLLHDPQLYQEYLDDRKHRIE